MDDPCKEFLLSYKEALSEIDRLRERKANLMDIATSITAKWNDAPGGGGDDGAKDGTLAALADTIDDVNRALQDAIARHDAVERFIKRVHGDENRIVLRLRYLRLMPWNDITVALSKYGIDYSGEKSVFRLHGRALKAAREHWAEAEKWHDYRTYHNERKGEPAPKCWQALLVDDEDRCR